MSKPSVLVVTNAVSMLDQAVWGPRVVHGPSCHSLSVLKLCKRLKKTSVEEGQ